MLLREEWTFDNGNIILACLAWVACDVIQVFCSIFDLCSVCKDIMLCRCIWTSKKSMRSPWNIDELIWIANGKLFDEKLHVSGCSCWHFDIRMTPIYVNTAIRISTRSDRCVVSEILDSFSMSHHFKHRLQWPLASVEYVMCRELLITLIIDKTRRFSDEWT